MNSNEKIAALRLKMAERKLDFYMITTGDAYLAIGGCVNDYWRTLKYLTGFPGTTAYMIVTPDKVGFWTDSRYRLIAEKCLKVDGLTVFDVADLPAEHYIDWMRDYVSTHPAGSFTFGVDGRTIAAEKGLMLRERFGAFPKPVTIVADLDLFGADVWPDRPCPAYKLIYELPPEAAAVSRPEKIQAVRALMQEKGADYYIVGGFEGTPWLTNLRGHESFSPMFCAHAVFTPRDVKLFCCLAMLPEEAAAHLKDDGFSLFEIDDLAGELRRIPVGASVYMDDYLTNYLMPYSVPEGCRLIIGMDLVNEEKAVKRPAEIENLKKACCLESVSMLRLHRYLKEHVGDTKITEFDLVDLIERFRGMFPEYIPANTKSLTAGYNENGAMPHYGPSPEGGLVMRASGVLTIDPQSSWLCGSTDTCRTVYLGPCEWLEELKEDYTLVLRSFIACCTQIIRKGGNGALLDSVARSVLWNGFTQYGHGTGHGVGYIGHCHEGPCYLGQPSYRKSWAFETYALRPGNYIAIEPGIYREGKYGVRVEDNLVVVPACENEFGTFYRLENLYYHPFERELILTEKLRPEELAWLNDYNKKCREKLSPYLTEEEKTYLYSITEPV